MPSCITHAVVAVGAGKAFAPKGVPRDSAQELSKD